MNLYILYLSVMIYHFLYRCDINLVKLNKISYILYKLSSIGAVDNYFCGWCTVQIMLVKFGVPKKTEGVPV